MSIKNNQKERKELTIEHKILFKNSFYSIIYSYANFFFSIITASLMARIISKDEWGFIILTLSLIGFFSVILIFLPPSLGLSMIYYVSQFKALNQNSKLRSFVRNGMILRFIFIIPIFFLSILIFTFFVELFKINLKEYFFLFYLLAPLIIVNGLSPILDDLLRSLNMFKTTIFLLILKNVIYIGGLFFLFIYREIIEVSYIAIVLIISSVVPFVISGLITYIKLQFKIKKTEEEGITFRECIKKIYGYGSYLSIISLVGSFNKEIRTQLVGFYVSASMVTGYYIGTQYGGVSKAALSPINRPLTISYTRLISKKQYNEIPGIFNIMFNYSLFLVLTITGFLFFTVDIFLYFIYGESFLAFSLLVKLLLFATIFTAIEPFLGSYLSATKKLKNQTAIISMFSFIKLAFFTIGVIFFNIIGAVIFSLISYIITSIFFTLILYKYNLRLKIKKTLLLYSIFFISLLGAMILDLILGDLYILILKNLNLLIFQYFNILSFSAFLILFLVLNILFKTISKSDIQYIEALFHKDINLHRVVKFGLRILKKITRN